MKKVEQLNELENKHGIEVVGLPNGLQVGELLINYQDYGMIKRYNLNLIHIYDLAIAGGNITNIVNRLSRKVRQRRTIKRMIKTEWREVKKYSLGLMEDDEFDLIIDKYFGEVK